MVMVTFDKEKGTFSITIYGGKEDYLNMVRGLVRMMLSTEEVESCEKLYYTACLISEMLPEANHELTLSEK